VPTRPSLAFSSRSNPSIANRQRQFQQLRVLLLQLLVPIFLIHVWQNLLLRLSSISTHFWTPSTTTRSSTPSSNVASSRFFNRQSALPLLSCGEEAIPLPESSISAATSKTNGKMSANDTNTILELQQHIISPHENIVPSVELKLFFQKVLISPSSSAPLPARAPPLALSGSRHMGQSIGVGMSGHSGSNTSNPVIPSQPVPINMAPVPMQLHPGLA